MPCIGLSKPEYLIRTELKQSLAEFPCSPVEPAVVSNMRIWSQRKPYFGKELSPNPKSAKFTPSKNVGGSLFKSNVFQNSRALAGKSPCPVVDTTNIVKTWDDNDS